MALPVFFLYQRLLSEEKNFRREIKSYIPYLIILTVYIALRKTVVYTSWSILDDILLRIAYIPYLVAYNLKLIFLPYNLHCLAASYPGSLLAPTVIGSFFLVFFLSVFLYALRRDSQVVFPVAAFFVTLLPVLNIINKSSVSLVAMRWLYLPLSFLVFGFVRLLTKAKLEVDRGKGAKQIVLMAIAVFFAIGSYTLNTHLWHDQETFLNQEVLHFNNELYMGDYAEMMLNKKHYREAEYFFQQSLEKTPLLARNFINYGALLIETGRLQEALDVLEKARSLMMDHKDRSDWNNNIGGALTLVGNYKRAHEYFTNALALDPQNVILNRNLAYLLHCEGRTQKATQHLKISERIKSIKQNK